MLYNLYTPIFAMRLWVCMDVSWSLYKSLLNHCTFFSESCHCKTEEWPLPFRKLVCFVLQTTNRTRVLETHRRSDHASPIPKNTGFYQPSKSWLAAIASKPLYASTSKKQTPAEIFTAKSVSFQAWMWMSMGGQQWKVHNMQWKRYRLSKVSGLP